MLAINRYRLEAAAFLAGLAFVPTSTAAAQVTADVFIHTGPVAGRVIVGPTYPRYDETVVYRSLPRRRVVVVERYAPRAVVIERAHGPRGKAHGWYRKHGYRPVTMYYRDGRFFDRVWYDRGYGRDPRFEVVVVYQRGGRYYLPADWRNYRGYDDGYYSTYEGQGPSRYDGYDDDRRYDGEYRHRGRDYDD